MRTSEETRALFNQWAASYDRDLAKPFGILEGYESSLRAAAESLALPPSAKVLDIGIGTGAFAALVAQSNGAQVFGLDVSERMLDQCRALHPEYQLQVGSFCPIPHDDGRFDAVISSFAFHETPVGERRQSCVEITRVLKPGGLLCLLDIMFASHAAVEDARNALGRFWDDEEVYARVSELDEDLRAADFRAPYWQQTAPYHWFVFARK
jgi:ubiquinone/menaquinone biosynthesis C-methylase UbiE